MKIWQKIKSFFVKQPFDKEAYERERVERLSELNDPDDDFGNDAVFSDEQLKKLARQSANRRDMRTAYYIVVGLIAVGMVVWGVINVIITPKPDIAVLIQQDEYVQEEDIAAIQEWVAQKTGDRNGDGKVIVEVNKRQLPSVKTEENGETYEALLDELTSFFIANKPVLIFGRQNFIDKASDTVTVEQNSLMLTQTSFGERETLDEYILTYRIIDNEKGQIVADVFSQIAS